jgi:hypothetical protein
VDVSTGKWTAVDFGIGGGVDSYFEYLVKGGIMFNIPELIDMFHGWYNNLVYSGSILFFFCSVYIPPISGAPLQGVYLKQLLNTVNSLVIMGF